jgi:formylglycine-generating enzyme required for sulfatase activity
VSGARAYSRGCAALLALLPALPLACQRELAPYGQTLVVVDTDVSVPRLVDRLRIDSFRADGTWASSRDLALLDPRDLPVSFGVYSEDEAHDTTVILRIRAYSGARVRDYRGERFVDPSAPPPSDPPADAPPRLVVQGVDVTPTTEPQPESTIDRLLAIVLRPGRVGAVSVTLRGDCFGTMARLSEAGSFAPLHAVEAATCIDTPHARVPLEARVPDPKASTAVASAQGSWLDGEGCASDDRTAAAVCVPSGAFFLGGHDSAGAGVGSLPERPVRVSRFWIDANEVTVADWRAAVDSGFRAPDASPTALDAPLPASSLDGPACTYSTAPLTPSRERHPVNCVTWRSARAYCNMRGGDLPTEAQWEYVAAAAGKSYESRYPWIGEDTSPPPCDRVVYDRRDRGAAAHQGACNRAPWPFGPAPVDLTAAPDKDATPLGVFNMAGNVSEWVLGSVQRLDSTCWGAAPPTDPACMDGRTFMSRGGHWKTITTPNDVREGAMRDGQSDTIGVRCVFAAKPD